MREDLEVRKNSFINKSNSKHSFKFDYSKVNYINNNQRVIIICPVHGEFKQTPKLHATGRGCSECYYEKRRFSLTDFIKKAQLIHGQKYDYSLVQYKNSRNNIKIICPIHGVFEQKANNHLNGNGCQDCYYDKQSEERRSSTEEFIKKAIKKHGIVYDYRFVDYFDRITKVSIFCKTHGIFEQSPANHLDGRGCPDCGLVGAVKSVHLSETNRNKSAILYLLKLSNSIEEFYKVGITIQEINRRISPISKFYNVEIISRVDTTLFEALSYEETFKKNYSNFRYIPTISFGGHTECFSKEIYKELFPN